MMDRIARADAAKRRLVFEAAAVRLGTTSAVMEKDFWVCYTLEHLFHRCPLLDPLTFKGGTSPSKAFHLIQRFSDDVNLILDWRISRYGLDEPWGARNNSAQECFKVDDARRTAEYLRGEFAPMLEDSLGESLGSEVRCMRAMSRRQSGSTILGHTNLRQRSTQLSSRLVPWLPGLPPRRRRLCPIQGV